MIQFKQGDDLPCFKYILANIPDGNRTLTAAFSLSYVQYLMRCGITDYKTIERSIKKFTLVAQMNFVSRSKPLDLLVVNGKRYSLTDQATFDDYIAALIKECRNSGASFSSVYKKIDSRLSMCSLCPMSSQYANRYYDKELLLAKFISKGTANYNAVITCEDDIKKLFTSYTDLYEVLNNLTKSYSAPLFYLLFSAIYSNITAYFNILFGSVEYSGIQRCFLKGLGEYGITPRVKNIDPKFDEIIYAYLLNEFERAKDIDMQEALSIKEELQNRQPFSPAFDVDEVTQLSASVKKERPKKNPAKKTSKKNNKDLQYVVQTPVSHSFDQAMGILDNPVAAGGAIEDKTEIRNMENPEHIEISLEKEDIVTSDGQMIVEHTVSDGSRISYDDEEERDDYDEEDFEDIDAEDEDNVSPENMVQHPGTPETSDMKISDPVSDDPAAAKMLETHIPLITDNAENGSAGCIEGTDGHTDNDRVFTYRDLLVPISISDADKESMQSLSFSSELDRIFSLSANSGYIVIEPATDAHRDYLLIAVANDLYYADMQSDYIRKILCNHKYNIFSIRILPLYSMLAKYNLITIVRKDSIIPLSDTIDFNKYGKDIIASAAEYFKFATGFIIKSKYGKDFKPDTTLLDRMYLYTALGSSLSLQRFLNTQLTDMLVGYDEDGGIRYMSHDPIPSDDFALAGSVYTYSLHIILKESDDAAKQTNNSWEPVCRKIQEDMLIHISSKACFNKFSCQVLSISADEIMIYADDYCKNYLSNLILITYFRLGDKYKYPLQVSVNHYDVGSKASS